MYLTYTQAQEILGITRRRMEHLLEAGEIPGVSVCEATGEDLFEEHALFRFADELSIRAIRRTQPQILPVNRDVYQPDEAGDALTAPHRVEIGISEEDCPVRAAFFASRQKKAA